MATRLDRFLESIDPSKTLDVVAARADEALNSFPMDAGALEGSEFMECVGRFVCHLDNHLLCLNPPRSYDPQAHWGQGCRLLEAEYGHDAILNANDLARTGVDGGLLGILRALARRRADEYASNEVAARVSAFWGGLTVEGQLSVADEYLAKYAHLLPRERTESGGIRTKIGFHKTLEQHPHMIQRLQRVGR